MKQFFENPLMLMALLGASLPIIIEIIFRKRKRRIQLPTIRYLLKSKEQQKVKNQDKILLILRTILLALLALALSRPLIRHGVVGDVSQRKVIILLDGSASTNQQVGVTTSFGLALKKASSMLKELPEDSLISAFVMNDQVEKVVENEKDRFMAASKIEGLRPSLGSLSMADGVTKITEYITEQNIDSPEVYIFSDFQKYTWSKSGDGNKKANTAIQTLNQKTTDVFLVDVGGEPAFNIIVESLIPSEWVVTAGNPVKFVTTLKIVGTAPSGQKGNVSFLVNGDKKDLKEFDYSKDQFTFEFDFLFTGSGEYLVEVLAEGDEHAVDNQRYFLCKIPEDHFVLVIDDTVEMDVPKSRSLQLAISPPDIPGMPKNSRFKSKVVSPNKLVYENLAKYSAVILKATGAVNEELAKKLEGYVKDGGALCMFAGDEINNYEYNKLFFKEGQGLLPRKIGAKKAGDNPTPYPVLSNSHPATGEFGDKKEFKDAAFHEYFSFEGAGAGDVLLNLSNDVPAILEKPFGKGKSIFVNTTIDPKWSFINFTIDYPVLIQELLRYIIGNPDASVNMTTGEAHVQNVYVSSNHILLRYPDGSKTRLTPFPGEEKGSLKVRFDRTNQQGVYQFDVMDGVLNRSKFIVNADAEEGDLSRYSEGDVKGSMAGTDYKWIPPKESLEDFVSKLNSVTELTDGILWLLVLSVLMESFLAAKFGKRRGGKAA